MRREPSGGSARNTRRWVGAFAVTALALTAALSVGSAGAKSTKAGQAKATTNLTMWFWGNDDAPGADKWLAAAVKSYEAKNPSIKIKVVTQPVATFIATFQAAAAAKSGPDIGAQWATGPVLTQVWGGAITAISDLVPKSETKNWLNTGENTYGGKIWAMPLYLIGIPWMYNKALMKQAGITDYPATKWSQLISYCKTLRAKNIVPFAFGNDTFWTTQLMTQDLDKLNDVVLADTGKASFTSKKYANFETGWKQMVDAKCFNDDVSSVPLAKGQQAFDAGKAAMTIATDGQARTFAKDLGGDSKVTVAKWPVFGTGALKNLYNATQSTSYFVTSWSKHKKEGAAFLTYLHTAAQLKAWYASGRQAFQHLGDHGRTRQEALRLQHDGQADLAAELLPAPGRSERQRPGPAAAARRARGRCRGGRDPRTRRQAVARPAGGSAEELASLQARLVTGAERAR